MVTKQNRFDLILNIFLFAVAVILFMRESNIPVVMEFNVPPIAKSRAYIRFITASLMVLSGILVVRASKNLLKKEEGKNVGMFSASVIITVIAFICYLLLMNIIGFYIDSFLLIIVLLTVYRLKEKGVEKPTRKQLMKTVLFSVVYAFISMILLHLIFVECLSVIVPRGII